VRQFFCRFQGSASLVVIYRNCNSISANEESMLPSSPKLGTNALKL
jgi:hypothetical protein